MKPPIQFRPVKAQERSSPSKAIPAKTKSKPGTRSPAPKSEHATVGSRRVVASGLSFPSQEERIKTGDEVSVAAVTHGQSSEPQQLTEFVTKGMAAQKSVDAVLEAYKELERAKVRERVKRHRAKKKTK